MVELGFLHQETTLRCFAWIVSTSKLSMLTSLSTEIVKPVLFLGR